MEWLMADWVSCSSRAVCVKLLVRASTLNARNCRLSSGWLIYEFDSWFPFGFGGAFITPKMEQWHRKGLNHGATKILREMNKKIHAVKMFSATRPALRLGFVPLTDCAPFVIANELGLFAKYGLRVELSRELGWATIRDKVIHGELKPRTRWPPCPPLPRWDWARLFATA